ncbi:SGNH/GDSL hydrolase family protein [Streptomyces sp. URMC 123]|uniref:SGNH/GDSL hydrolase family protein n=1 Tax=Streptomyces sp. URMC 123 TaxID=3423403 RepID=UPI003F1ABD27
MRTAGARSVRAGLAAVVAVLAVVGAWGADGGVARAGHGGAARSAAVAAPVAAPAAGRAAGAEPFHVLYLGDSLATESAAVVRAEIEAAGRARVRAVPYGGMTLCDYLEGRPETSYVPAGHKAAALVRAERTDVVVLQFWGNSWQFTPCMNGIPAGTEAYYERLRSDARELTDQIGRAAGSRGPAAARPRVVWVAQGPDADRPDRIRRLNGVYAAQAAATGDLVADAGWHVSMAAYPYDNLPRDRYRWTRYLPCTEFERTHPEYCTEPDSYGGVTRLHRDDDPLHFCLVRAVDAMAPCGVPSPGVLRYGRAIATAVTNHLESAPPT